MRGAKGDPPTVGARGRSTCLDAHTCKSVCFSENVNCGTSKGNVQGRTRGSESAAHESIDTHYLLRDPPKTDERTRRGKFKKKGKKRHSRKAAYVQALSVEDALRMLENDLNIPEQSVSRSKSPQLPRRSARLARNQKRTGRWRNDVKQRKDAEEASRRSERAASAGERNTRRGARNARSAEPARGSSAVEREKNKMREKLRPNEEEILDSVLGNGVQGRKTAGTSSSSTNVNVPSSLRESEETKVQELARDWAIGGHGAIKNPKPDGVLRIAGDQISSICVSNKHHRAGGPTPERPRLIDGLRKQSSVDIYCTIENRRNWQKMLPHLQYGELFGRNELTRSVACHNEHSDVVNQYGGTGMTIFGRLSTIAKPGKDPSGLGRASWLLLENDGRKLRVVTAYRPCVKQYRKLTKKGRIGQTV